MAIQRISAEKAFEQLQEGVPYVDVRTGMEFEAGHPEGSYHIPLAIYDPRSGMMALNPDFLPTMKEHFPTHAPVMVACKAGVRSANAAILLEREGYETILEVGPGWSGGPDENGMYAPGWATCGFPSNTGDGGERSFENLRVEADD